MKQPARRMRLAQAAVSMLVLAAASCADDEPREKVAELFTDPRSARFQGVRERGDFVCGEVNGKAGERGYTGYRRFVYDRLSRRAHVDPAAAPGTGGGEMRAAVCSKPFAYQSVEERLSCAAAPEQEAEASRRREFETAWLEGCARD